MTIKILQGNCIEKIKEIKDNSIDCVITSPPYWGLRNYNVDGQLGLESTYQEHIQNIIKLFRIIKPKLKDSATIWLNYGDSYATTVNGRSAAKTKEIGNDDRGFVDKPFSTIQGTIKPKDLVMIPNRIAIALQDDGWWIRSEIIWHKPNPMPESIKDRPTSCHEKIWLITKNKKYYYDADAIKEPCKVQVSEKTKIRFGGNKYGDSKDKHHQTKSGNNYVDTGLKNKRNVWTVSTKPFKDAHFATFPKDLIEPCIKAGCPEKVCVKCGKPQVKEFYRDKSTLPVKRNKRDGDGDRAVGGVYQKWLEENPPQITIKPSCDCNADFKPGIVLDPFGGSGTTGIVAALNNRNAILIELSKEYVNIAKKRINTELGLFKT